jgi:hypothetical protein
VFAVDSRNGMIFGFGVGSMRACGGVGREDIPNNVYFANEVYMLHTYSLWALFF